MTLLEPLRAVARSLRDRYLPELRRRRAEFAALNRGLPPDRLALRRGVEFGVDGRARESMEYFAMRSWEMSREMDAFLAATADRRRLLDVGALHGVFSLAFTAARPGRTALAVEPSQDAFEILSHNARLNPDLKIELSAVALGRSSGSIRMRQNWQHLEALSSEERAEDARSVAVESADELCERHAFLPDVVKVDVEGFEGEVLAGSRRLLEARPLLLLELHPRALLRFGTSAEAMLVALRSLGYRIEPIGRRLPAGEAGWLRRQSVRILARPDEMARASR